MFEQVVVMEREISFSSLLELRGLSSKNNCTPEETEQLSESSDKI